MVRYKAKEATEMEFRPDELIKAREVEGLKAYRKLMKLLSKKDIKSIEKSARAFHKNFKLG